jgi:peptidoglycan lytic transglycosylase
MKTDANRPWRKYQLWTALLLVMTTLALGVAPAQAETGGLSAATSSEAGAGADSAFAPMRWAGATWYGPGLYGRHTACGQLLTAHTLGVAHRSLPCGTTVKFTYRGRSIVTQVIDRGPYSKGNSWDLTLAAAEALDFDQAGADQVGYAVALGEARKPTRAGGNTR